MENSNELEKSTAQIATESEEPNQVLSEIVDLSELESEAVSGGYSAVLLKKADITLDVPQLRSELVTASPSIEVIKPTLGNVADVNIICPNGTCQDELLANQGIVKCGDSDWG